MARLAVSCAVVVVGLLTTACSSDPPPGRFACTTEEQCPSGWVCECNLCYATAGAGGDCVDGGGTDAGVDGGPGCADCDDGVDCTIDTCTDGCESMPDDTRCTVPDCASARCDLLDGCVVETDDAMCADDGNPCTAERCDAEMGCVSEPVEDSTPCDDGTFCNGPDTCVAGWCTEGPGDPCPGASTCDEELDTCTGCIDDGDCPPDTPGAWTACDFGGDPCPTAGTRTRSVTLYTCTGGMCTTSTISESGPCTRPSTDGVGCAGDSDRCTDDVCMGGTCTHPSEPDNTVCGTRVNRDRCCGGVCRDLFTTDQHCGACGIACRNGTTCENVDTGSGVPGGACQGCGDGFDCPLTTGGTWVCEQRGGSGPYRCECRDRAACGGAPHRCGSRAVQVCRPE